MERAIAAWRFSVREITGVRPRGDFGAVFFDGACVLTSPNALSAANDATATWTAAPHTGTVTLPNGDDLPAGVTSFASGEGSSFFVMSTPSVWQAGGVRGDPLDLDAIMVFVLLHEGSHVAQMATYGQRVGALAESNHLPEEQYAMFYAAGDYVLLNGDVDLITGFRNNEPLQLEGRGMSVDLLTVDEVGRCQGRA